MNIFLSLFFHVSFLSSTSSSLFNHYQFLSCWLVTKLKLNFVVRTSLLISTVGINACLFLQEYPSCILRKFGGIGLFPPVEGNGNIFLCLTVAATEGYIQHFPLQYHSWLALFFFESLGCVGFFPRNSELFGLELQALLLGTLHGIYLCPYNFFLYTCFTFPLCIAHTQH